MTRLRPLFVMALAAGLFLLVGETSAQFPRPKSPQPKPKVVPPTPAAQPGGATELPFVPKSTAAFISVKVSDLIDHPDLKAALEQLKKTPEALDGVMELIGVPPHELERITMFWPMLSARGPSEPILVLTTKEPYNEARVLKALRAEPVFGDGPLHRGHGDGPGFGNATKNKPSAVDSPPIPSPKSAEPPIEKSLEPLPKASPMPKPIEKQRAPEESCVATAAVPDGPGDPLFYSLHRGPHRILFLLDERTLVFLPEGSRSEFTAIALIGQLMHKNPTGPLADAIGAGGTHTLAAGVYLPPLFRAFDQRGLPAELAPYAALTAAKTAVLTGDLGKTAKLNLKLTFEDAAAARRAAPVLEEGLRTLAEKATDQIAEIKERSRSNEKALIPLIEALSTGLKKATVTATGTTVTATTEIDVGPAAGKAVAELLQSLQSRKKFADRSNSLKQIGLALHNYEAANGKLPTNVYGPKGEPLLSWRVHLLPYLEQDALYRQFKLDEPWDSANNKPLIERMPKVFEIVGREAPKGKTFLQAFLTPDPQQNPRKDGGTSWLVEGGKVPKSLAQIPDGTSNTLAVVEARNPVIWSKPDDLPFGEKIPPLGAEGADRFMVLMLDGSVRAISTKIKPETLRLLIDAQDGMVLPDVFEDDDPRPSRAFPKPSGGGASSATDASTGAIVPGRPAQVELLKVQLEQAQDELRKEEIVAQVLAQDARRILEAFKRGAAAKLDVAKAELALEEALARVQACKRVVQVLREAIAAATKGSGGGTPPTKSVEPTPKPDLRPPAPSPKPTAGDPFGIEKLRDELAQAKAELEVGRAELAKAKAFAEFETERLERVLKAATAGVAAQREVDEAKAVVEASRAQVKTAEARVALLSATVDAAKAALDKTVGLPATTPSEKK